MPPRVLIIDAEPVALARTAQILAAADFIVTAVSEFDVAKQQLRLAAPDVLVVDVRLGSYNGLQLALRARLDHPNMVAVLTHAFRDLVKPFDAATLVAVVRRLQDAPAA